MRLYHYAAEIFPELKTRRKAGGLSSAEIKNAEKEAVKFHDEGAYIDHISFFFDPIPSKLLANIYGSPHRAWFRGNRLFEYVIDSEVLDKDILYRVVESERKVAHLDQFSKDNNWVEDNPELLMKYIKEINRLQTEWGELGRGLVNLNKQITLNKGKTEQAYVRAASRDDFQTGRDKYAANVPHLMIYPSSGEITYTEINSLIIGNDKRVPVKNKKPAAFNWT